MKEDTKFDSNNVVWEDEKVTAKDGLLWVRGGKRVVDLPAADILANCYGFACAEQLVKAMEKK